MTDRPILFSSPMVKALLAGNKSQTRRLLPAQPQGGIHPIKHLIRPFDAAPYYQWRWHSKFGANLDDIRTRINIGDRLYVREHWRTIGSLDSLAPRDIPRSAEIIFEADAYPKPEWRGRFRQAMHMPKWASRITLLVDDVKVERLQDISEDDAIAEGVVKGTASFDYDVGTVEKDWWRVPGFEDTGTGISAVDMYASLWEHINGEGAWDQNPWIVCYCFRVVLENIDYIGRRAA
jgi:hypothetical protein